MVMLDQLNVVKQNKLSSKDLNMVYGGGLISGSLLNAFTSAFKVLYGFGQNFGSSIRRVYKKKLCKF